LSGKQSYIFNIFSLEFLREKKVNKMLYCLFLSIENIFAKI